MIKISPRHALAAGYCSKGARLFFKKHKLDYREYVLRGIDAEKIRGLNDSYADNVIKQAEKEIVKNGK